MIKTYEELTQDERLDGMYDQLDMITWDND